MTIEFQLDIVALQRIGRIVPLILHKMLDSIEAGMTTAELDAIGARLLAEFDARSAPHLVYDFPGATCISVNEQAAHGVSGGRIIKVGDLVDVDVFLRSWMAIFRTPAAPRLFRSVRRSRQSFATPNASLWPKRSRSLEWGNRSIGSAGAIKGAASQLFCDR